MNTLSKIREDLGIIIFGTDTRAGRVFDELLLALIFMSVVIVMLRSVESINSLFHNEIVIWSNTITTVFTIEYILRIWTSKSTRGYIFSFYGIIDFLAILPGFLGRYIDAHNLLMLRSLRLLRLFRVLKLGTYQTASSMLWRSLVASRARITVFLLSVVIIVLVVGTMMYIIEGPAAGFDNIPISVYRCIVTITTVGYGDITPITPLGQALSAILMLIGYGIIAIPTGIVSAEMVMAKEKRMKGKNEG